MVAATVSRLETVSLFKTLWPFVLTALRLLILFPSLTLWLPATLG